MLLAMMETEQAGNINISHKRGGCCIFKCAAPFARLKLRKKVKRGVWYDGKK